MNKYLVSALAGLAIFAAGSMSSAHAGGISVGVSIGLPVFVAAPVYYEPVYYPPPPVYYAPRVVYAPPVYYAPRVVYSSYHRHGHHSDRGHRGHWR